MKSLFIINKISGEVPKRHKGFTLIGLLVVIAIIGLLSTIAIVAMGGARAKARDAKRISDIKQMSTILDIEEAVAPGTSLTGCVGGDARTNTCTNAGDIIAGFGTGSNNAMCDPAGKCALAVICSSAAVGTAACDYSISRGGGGALVPTTANYEICFFMESANQFSGFRGIYRIEDGGIVTAPAAADGNACS